MCVNAGEEHIRICVWVNPLTSLFKKKKVLWMSQPSCYKPQIWQDKKRRQRNCRGGRVGAVKKKKDKPGRDQKETSGPASSDGEDQFTVRTCTAKINTNKKSNWTPEIKSANHSPAVNNHNIWKDTNATIIFNSKTHCVSLYATKHA